MKKSIGQQLRETRESHKLTLEQVANATHMRERYLRALEDGKYDIIPSMAQARGFLRAYASYLKMNPESLLQDLDGDLVEQAPIPVLASASRISDSPAVSYEQADEIFVDIGRRLQNQRELLGLSLDDVVRYTHVRRHYLQALETGKLDELPSPVQGRGMLDNYAIFLGMDPEPLLLRFAEGLQARLSVRQVARVESDTGPAPRRQRPLPAPIRRLLSPDILIGVTFAVFLIVFVVWGAIRIFAIRSTQAPSPTAPSIAEILLATATPSSTPTAEPSIPTSPVAQTVVQPEAVATDATAAVVIPTGSASGVQVYLTILQRAWMRVTVDGKIEFEGRVIPSSAYSFVGETMVEILTSNGAGLQAFYNQQDLGALGDFGQVVNMNFTPQGVVAPTPTVTRTPTATLRVTPTVTVPNLPGIGGTPSLP